MCACLLTVTQYVSALRRSKGGAEAANSEEVPLLPLTFTAGYNVSSPQAKRLAAAMKGGAGGAEAATAEATPASIETDTLKCRESKQNVKYNSLASIKRFDLLDSSDREYVFQKQDVGFGMHTYGIVVCMSIHTLTPHPSHTYLLGRPHAHAVSMVS